MIIVITGPTALGKTKTAINIAQKIGAEIVNGDAFQSYKYLNIGVAKPTAKELASVPHHLYSIIEPTHNYSIAEYQSNLRQKIKELLDKNVNIIIVGGSGLYIRSALFDYDFKPNNQVNLHKFESMDNVSLHNYLKTIDSSEAEKIHFNNRKRVLRAIEIYLSNGKTKTDLLNEQEHKLIYDAKFFVRDISRDELYDRINKRVDLMFEQGLEKEVKELISQYNETLHCFQAIGYKELIDSFKNKTSISDAKELIKQHTRNYAKRQMTYIRHQFDVCYYKNDEDILKELKYE